jgi:ATP-dependent DNA helicase RecQ
LRYFGDADAPRSCQGCESCLGSRAPEAEAVAEPKRKARATEPAQPEGPFDQQIFDKLRALRTELARESQVPPYVIFHDATLRELARVLPHDERSFLAVKGAGPGRWQRYGGRVVAIISTARPAAEQSPMVRDSATPVRRDTLDALWSLCEEGASLDQICHRLRRSPSDVADELAAGARAGRSLDAGRLLGPERVDAIRAAAHGGDGDLVAVRKRLPFPAALAEIRLALL